MILLGYKGTHDLIRTKTIWSDKNGQTEINLEDNELQYTELKSILQLPSL